MGSRLRSTRRSTSARITSRFEWPLLVAVPLVVVFHFSLLLFGSFRRTYDAWVHLFFADHYQRGWFNTWEPRWYTGFSTVSYPPGTHQLLAVVGWVFSLPTAFIVVGTCAVMGIVIGTYRSAQIWVDRRSAAYAALLAAVSSSIAETIHTFGQIPTLVSLAFALNGLPFAHRWVRDGRFRDLLAAWAFAAATTAVHHVTTLFGLVFIIGPVVARPVIVALSTPAPGEQPNAHFSLKAPGAYLAMRLRRILPTTKRAVVYLFGAVGILVVVVLPYWLYSRRDPISQISIPHGSRENFIAHPNLGLIFFVIPWGLVILTLPYATLRGLTSRAWPLAATVLLLFVLGTGGTTPIPRLLLGGAFDILTLDRFTFWSTILILPLSGACVQSVREGRLRTVLNRNLGVRCSSALQMGLVIVGIGFTIFAASLAQLRDLQPKEIEMAPIASFLTQDYHDQWRYLTLGFGDQMAWLSAQTDAETVDGNYHSARRLPELTSRPVERLEGAKYTGVAGLGSLQEILANPERFHLKFVFSNDKFYDPLLWASGWQQLEPLENGIRVWQRDDVTPLPPDRVSNELPNWQRAMWGIIPPLSMIAGLLAGPAMLLIERSKPRIGSGWHGRGWGPLDRALQRRAAKLNAEPWTSFGYRWRSLPQRIYRRAARPPSTRRLWAQRTIVVMVVVLAAAPWAAPLLGPGDLTPEEVVFDYYDSLDLRQVDRAYTHIDPDSVTSQAQYLAEYRVTSGLVSSFARLESMSDSTVEVSDDRATVSATLTYLTSLSRQQVEVVEQLRRVDGEWKLIYRPIDYTVAPEPVAQQPTVDYLNQGRRQPIDGPTASQDVLDRPVLEASPAAVMKVGGELAVVGELTNIDSAPAYVTVSAVFYNAYGVELGRASNGVGTQFTLRPAETGPYRIDLAGVAGADGTGELEFDPETRTPSGVNPDEVAAVSLDIRSLVNQSDLDRYGQFVDVSLADNTLSFELFNSGTVEISVGQFFVTLRRDGQPYWVVNAFTPSSVAPRKSKPQRIELPQPADIEPIAATVNMVVNAVPADPYSTNIEPLTEWSEFDLTAMQFFRSVG